LVAGGHDFGRLLQHSALDSREMRKPLAQHVPVKRFAPRFEPGSSLGTRA
jgi:hypothetical protein